jgi:hypothetical protein
MENLSRKEMVKKTFDQMPRSFTSHEFVNKMIEIGIERDRLYLYNHIRFLKNNCLRESKKTWRKLPLTMNEQMEDHRSQFKTKGTSAGVIFNPEGSVQQIHIGTSPQGSDFRIRTTPIPEGSTILPGSVVENSTGTYSAIITLEKRIELAIALLKANGYKIYKVKEEEI